MNFHLGKLEPEISAVWPSPWWYPAGSAEHLWQEVEAPPAKLALTLVLVPQDTARAGCFGPSAFAKEN